MKIKFKGKRIDTDEWVSGHYFKTPLTDENSGTDPEAGWYFLTGETRHCISNEDGAVFVVDAETVCVDRESLDGEKISMDEYISTVYGKAMNAKDNATGLSHIQEMVDNILEITVPIGHEPLDDHNTRCVGDCVYPNLGTNLNSCVNCGQPKTITSNTNN